MEPHQPNHDKTTIGDDPDSFDISLWPADQCARAMHDEDCANGLWMTNNERSASWPVYGDSQMFSSKGNLDFDAALDATQTSVKEVWMAFQSATDSGFEALKKVSHCCAYVDTHQRALFPV